MRPLYLRFFGLTALIATGSYWVQLSALAGAKGLAPMASTMEWLHAHGTFAATPTLLWLSSSDAMLNALCAACVICALLVFLDLQAAPALVVFWAAWTSLVNVGEPFLSFQWDILLCEAAVLSIPYALFRDPPPWARLLVVLGAVKVTLESGIVKLTAGDRSWWPDLTALTYHYWTQPLPTWTSVVLNRAPLKVHQAACLAMFIAELGIPLLAFVPLKRAKQVAAVGMIALQVGLGIAGNYSYFNLLAATLCIPLFDDSKPVEKPRTRAFGWATTGLATLLSVLVFMQTSFPGWSVFNSFKLLNAYGAFRVMTKTRPEIILEGSVDGVTWAPYEFRWKPGRVDKRPDFVAPLQPRLDWQMWFAALGTCGRNPWLLNLMRGLMRADPEALGLMGENPFSKAPPKMIRSTVWQYRFAEPGSDAWWTRTEQGPYCPTVALDPDGNLLRAN